MGILSKIMEVFTKEYKEETKYQIYMEENVDKMKLANENFDADEAVERLKRKEFQNNLHVSTVENNKELVSEFHSKEEEENFSKIAEEEINPDAKLKEDDNQEYFRLNPMMPRRYNQNERKRIREAEKKILEAAKKEDLSPMDMYLLRKNTDEKENEEELNRLLKKEGVSLAEFYIKHSKYRKDIER